MFHLSNISPHTCIRTYVCMHVCMCVCMYACTYIRMYVYMYVCMYVRTYVRMYVCTYVRTYIHTYTSAYFDFCTVSSWILVPSNSVSADSRSLSRVCFIFFHDSSSSLCMLSADFMASKSDSKLSTFCCSTVLVCE